MKPQFIPIRKKLQWIVVSVTLTAVLLSMIGNIVGDVWVLHGTLVKELTVRSESMMGNSATALARGEPAVLTREFGELGSNVRLAALYDQDGRLFASYARPGSGAAAPAGPGPNGAHLGRRMLVLVQPVVDKAQVVGRLYLAAEYDIAQIILDGLKIALPLVVLALGAAVLLVGRLDTMVTGPIGAAASAVRSMIGGEDETRRLAHTSHDEVAALVDAVNDLLAAAQRRSAQLVQAQADVRRLNEALELRMRERSAQLDEAHRKLDLANAAAAEARAQAEEAGNAKSAFLSGMSHELRTPLNAILGFAQLLASIAHTEEHRQEFAGYILKGGRHLLTLIDAILDLNKAESGAMMLSMEAVSVADVMLDCKLMVEPLARQRQIAIAFPESSEAMVQADRTRLKQVLLNLLSNAIKYNRSAGSVLVECRPVSGGRVRIGVRDSGTGLSSAQLAALFQPFNRLGQEGGSEEGIGIGLVVAKRLVELMGGTIGARSTPGNGSEFWIELAAGTAALPPHVTAAPRVARHGFTPALLYVDDNPPNLKLVEALVRLNPDVRLLTAPDAHLGLQLARAHLPDVILMDLNLPGMSGSDALRRLRADPATAQIPVIAVTANAALREAAPGTDGFFRYLGKPINVNEFWQGIRAALASRKTEEVA